jgi:hypothetical protein
MDATTDVADDSTADAIADVGADTLNCANYDNACVRYEAGGANYCGGDAARDPDGTPIKNTGFPGCVYYCFKLGTQLVPCSKFCAGGCIVSSVDHCDGEAPGTCP